MSSDDKKKTLTDAEITTARPDRRAVLGVMAAGGAAGVGAATLGTAAQAQIVTDSDNGRWSDDYGCGRGYGQVRTGINDRDNGTRGTDAGGYGRGRPYC